MSGQALFFMLIMWGAIISLSALSLSAVLKNQ